MAIPTTFTDVQPKVASPFVGLPPLMWSILQHDENADINQGIQDTHQLNGQQRDAMMKVIRKIILKTISPDQLVKTIQTDIGLPEDQAKSLALDLLGRRFLAMEWYIGPVQPLIRILGGNVEEFLNEAKKMYPEVYAPPSVTKLEVPIEGMGSPLLQQFDERMTSARGRAEILLRLTGLSTVLEQKVADGALAKSDGESLMGQLDSISYAINTKDLNPFEIQAIKRRLRRLLSQIEG